MISRSTLLVRGACFVAAALLLCFFVTTTAWGMAETNSHSAVASRTVVNAYDCAQRLETETVGTLTTTYVYD